MMKLSRFLFLSLTALYVNGATEEPIVDLGYAKYRGFVISENEVVEYLGIRYAAPPTDDLRWREPHVPAVVDEVQDANSQPKKCIQSVLGLFEPPSNSDASEDCLFLNVYTPASSGTAQLPVIIWIHGGAFKVGEASTYDGGKLVVHGDHAVITVVIQYRLGIFGFLAGKEVQDNGALNAGLLDQELALRWVQEHISKFGGDSNQVTIWGESAGGSSVLQHLLAYEGKTEPPLFHRAILSSPSLAPVYRYNHPIPQKIYDGVVERVGCSSTGDTLSCLRSIDVSVLASANIDVSSPVNIGQFGAWVFVPVIDTSIFTQSPIQALRKKTVNLVDSLMAVANTDEGRMFVSPDLDISVPTYMKLIFPGLDEVKAVEGANLYKGFGTPYEQMCAIRGEATFVCAAHQVASAYPGVAYKATFAIPPGLHVQDVPYYFTGLSFPGLTIPPVFNNTAFIRSFARSFLSIARASDPNVKFMPSDSSLDANVLEAGDTALSAMLEAQRVFNPNATAAFDDPLDILPSWPLNNLAGVEMLFAKTNNDRPDVRAVESDAALLERCRFWESVASMTGQ